MEANCHTPDQSLTYLEQLVGEVSHKAVEHWLKISGLECSARNSESFFRILDELIAQNRLAIADLSRAVREIEESGGKQVFLRKIRPRRPVCPCLPFCPRNLHQERFPNRAPLPCPSAMGKEATYAAHLADRNLRLANEPNNSVRMPDSPTLNYIYRSKSQIIVKYSETHSDRHVVPGTQSAVEKKSTKFALAVVDIKTRFVQIRLDPPGQFHSHTDDSGVSQARLYEDFYFTKFLELLDGERFDVCDLTIAAESIIKADPLIFRPLSEMTGTESSPRQRHSEGGHIHDKSADGATFNADFDIWKLESMAGYWIPGESEGRLRREVFTEVQKGLGIIRFQEDCLSSELDYVLFRINQFSHRQVQS